MKRGGWGAAWSAATVAICSSGLLTSTLAVAADLFILASGPDPLKLIMSRTAASPGARVMASADCIEYRPGLYVVAVAANSASAPPGAYRKHCTPKPGSLTALGIPAVDRSFAALREEPVNFDGSDIVTRIEAGLLVRPWYAPEANDPREGLREAVEDLSGMGRPIERDCSEAQVARSADHIAIACATEQAADQSLFRTRVYRARDLARVREVPRCRKPRLVPGALVCEAQAVTADGRMTTALRRIPLS